MSVGVILITLSVLAFIGNSIIGLPQLLRPVDQSTYRVSLSIAAWPLSFLMMLLCVNVVVFGDDTLGGPNQLALLAAAGLGALIAQRCGQSGQDLWEGIKKSLGDTLEAIFILLLIGSLAGTWMLSGVVPAMIDYGLLILSPSYFLVATCLLCALVSLASGSSWSTVATVGIALLGVGQALGFSPGLCAGAIISGAYFGDKMSPLSDTTNLAPAMVGGSLIPHIRAMLWTTTPAFLIALIIFTVLGLGGSGTVDAERITLLRQGLREHIWIHPVLFVVPLLVAVLIAKRVSTLTTLTVGILSAGLLASFVQPQLVTHVGGESGITGAFKAVVKSMSGEMSLPASDPMLHKLLTSKGMYGMLNTIWLIICALAFGGIMERSGFLKVISASLLKKVQHDRGLVTAAASTSIFLNVTASDQYLAIVVPGKMYRERFEQNGLAPEALSRTLEDAGTVTSVLIPWNTCGATQSAVLGVATMTYLPFCFFNLLSPLMTFIFAFLGWRQPRISSTQ